MDRSFQISNFADFDHPAVYADNNYFALSPLALYPELCKGMSVNCLIFIFCTEGHLNLTLNARSVGVDAGGCVVCPPNAMIANICHDEHSSATIVGYSMEILTRMLTGGERVWRIMAMLTQKPVISNDERYVYNHLSTFLNMLRYRTSGNDIYQDEIVYHLFATLFFDVINDFHIPADSQQKTEEPQGSHFRTAQLYKLFLAHLNKDNGSHRAIGYFADKLFITPKYLSKITRYYCGQSALRLITCHAVECLKLDLRYSDRPLKEIALDFRFESYSAFCKFIKKHLGKTPQEYRKG